MKKFRKDISFAANDIDWAMYLCMLYLVFPLNASAKYIFLKRTGRDTNTFWDIQMGLDAIMFILTCAWLYNHFYYKTPLPGNELITKFPVPYTQDEIFILNIANQIGKRGHIFDFLLSFISLFAWVQAIYQLRLHESFGHMFKIMHMLTIDLTKFMIIWFMELFMFACISILIFGECKGF